MMDSAGRNKDGIVRSETVASDYKIIVIGPSWVGDMVMAQSLFITLKQERPDCVIDVLAPGWSKPLLQRMPEVDRALEMPLGHGVLDLKTRYRLGKALRGHSYYQAILLPNSLKSALVPWFAKIPKRTGWKGEMRYVLLNDIRHLDKSRLPLMVDRFNALAFPPGNAAPSRRPAPRLVTDNQAVRSLLDKFSMNHQRKILALCPGAEFGPAKRWPERHYAAVAGASIDAGWQVWLFGSSNDHLVASTIMDQLSPKQRVQCRLLAGETSLEQAIDLLAVTDAVVSNDSGLMHIAAALDRPLVVVYGSTSPAFTPPLNEQAVILSVPVDCGPCFNRECPEGHLKCLNDLAPERVISALKQLVPE